MSLWFGLSAGPSLSRSIVLGLIGDKSDEGLFTNTKVCPESAEKALFQQNYATMPARKGSGFKNRNPGVFSLGKELLKNIFLLR